MAVAFDTSAQKTLTASPTTLSFTTTGSDRFLVVGTYGSTNYATSVTYNGVAMTRVADMNVVGGYFLSMWILAAPASGANDITVTGTGSFAIMASSFTGVPGTTYDAFSTNSGSGISLSTSTTVVASNCWLVSTFSCESNPTGGGTNNTQRQSLGNWFIGDSNGVVGTGAQTATVACNSGGNVGITISLSPTAGGGGGGSTRHGIALMGVGI